jgi:hypothetical protein
MALLAAMGLFAVLRVTAVMADGSGHLDIGESGHREGQGEDEH